jgi:hypothetical protein
MKDRTLLADLPLAAAAAVLGAVALGASLTGAGRAGAALDARAGGDAVARVTDLVADPRLRPVGTLVWRELSVGTKLVRHDAVYVPEGAEVSLAFDDGTRLAIAERSLVIIDRDVTRGASLELVSGAVRGAAGTGALSVRAADAHATVAPGGELSVARLAAGGSARVTVHAGDARLKAGGEDVRMAGGEARDVDAKGKLGAAETLSVALAAPAPGERVAPGEADGASVRFEWRAASAAAGALRLEVAREADFVALVYGAVTASPATVTGLAPGVYHWRVRAEGGADRSEERTFVVSALRAPVPVQPRAGEVVYLPAGALYTLAWSPVPGATRYRVEVAAERRFDHADVDRLVTAPRLVLEGGLGESMYAWRVRAIGPDGAESVPSRAVPFRLIVKPIPAAPRLLDPELRLYDEEGAAPFPAPRTGPSPAPSPAPASPSKPPPPAAPTPAPAPHGEEGGLLWRLIGGVAWADEPVAADKDVGAAIVLRWTPVPGIKRYRLQIAEDDKFAKVIVDATVDGAFYEWRKIAKRDYWWRVQSIDAEGRPGEFSPAKRVGAVLSAPALEAPAAGAAFATGAAPLTVTLRWAKAALARGYEVEIGGVTLAAKDASLAYRPAAPGEFTWRVRAVDAAGGKTPFGESRAFRVVLGAPAASPVAVPAKPFAAGAAPLSLRWSEVEGAAEYEVEVSPSKKFAPVAASAKTAAHAFGWTPPSAGNFYWRVRSLAPGVASSEWSKAAALALPLAPPSVKAPAAGATLRFRGAAGFDVAWSDVPGATSYEVVIVAALAAAGAPAAVRLGADHSPAHVAGLDAGSYALRVRALGAGGAAADSTEQPLVLAALDALPAPATLAPAPGGSVTYRGTPPPLRLAWSAVPDAASYEVAVESGATAGGGASAPAPRTAKSATSGASARSTAPARRALGARPRPSISVRPRRPAPTWAPGRSWPTGTRAPRCASRCATPPARPSSARACAWKRTQAASTARPAKFGRASTKCPTSRPTPCPPAAPPS